MAADEFTDTDVITGADVGEPPARDEVVDAQAEMDEIPPDPTREANEADVAEQVLEVPYDEDYPETPHE